MTRNIDKLIVCFNSGIILSFINLAFGKIDYSVIMLIIVMVTDFITGVLCGYRQKQLSSRKCFDGLCRKLMILIYVMLAHHFDMLLHVDYVRMGVCYMYIVSETISIFENGVKLGVDIPEPIQKALEILQSKGDKDNENK